MVLRHFFYAGHLVDSNGGDRMINVHVDPFGPLHPFHCLLQFPSSKLFSASPTQGAICMLNGGCSVP
jgi:hypothetical protein